MPSLLDRAGRRNLVRNPWQLALAVSGIALGVAVVVGVDMANSSVERAFAASSELVAGRATHQIIPVQGNLPDALYVALRTETGVTQAAPVLEAVVRLAALPDTPVTLRGVDLFAEAPFRPFTGAAALNIETLLMQPGAAVIPYGLAARLGVKTGQTFSLASGQPLTVAGVLSRESITPALSDGFIIVDIASAQELLDAHGQISRIDLILDPEQVARVQPMLSPSQLLVTTGPRTGALLEMTRGFRTNLTAMSLMAVMVGAFLIYNTMAFLVVRRVRVTGMFRALGVTRHQVFFAILREACLIGAAGTLLGLIVGTVLGSGLVSLALRTVNDIYFSVVAAPGALDGRVLAKGTALGLLGTLLAAAAPAWEASAAAPRASLSRAGLEHRSRQRAGRAALLAIPCLALAGLLLAFGTRSLSVSFAGLFAFAGAATMLTPVATAALMTALHRLLPGSSVMGRLAARSVTAGLSRTGVAVSALMLAVATVIGVGLMITSFRGSVVQWLENVVQADFYLGATDRNAPEPAVTDALLARVASMPGVLATGAIRHAWVPTSDGQRRVWAIESSAGDSAPALGLMLKRPDTLPAGLAEGSVLISEPYSVRHEVGVGDRLALPTPAGRRDYPVAGIFVDYSSDRGVIAMHRTTYRRDFGDDRLDAIRAYVDADKHEAVRYELDTMVANANGTLQLADSRNLRDQSLEIFDRTFTITEVLRLLAGLVAFLGVLSALQALALERSREFATLRAIGCSPRQILSLIVGQSSLLGLAAGALAIPTGIALAALLVYVINQRAFGWSMQLDISLLVLLQGVALALIAAMLAGIYPAWKSASAIPAKGLREE